MNANRELTVWLEGIGCWTPDLPDWNAMRAWLCGGPDPEPGAAGKPRPALLPPGERRRAPYGVLVAVEVASQAIAMSGRDAARVPCVFASAHTDLEILDYTCATLATAPAEMSPTRFHNSVHNAAAGYWTMTTGCHAGANALTAHEYTFGTSVLEAASLADAESTPVLLVANDGAGCGPLAEVIASTRHFACALVLAPEAGPRALMKLTMRIAEHEALAPQSARARALSEANLSAAGSPLLEALANGVSSKLRIQAAPRLDLDMTLEFLA